MNTDDFTKLLLAIAVSFAIVILWGDMVTWALKGKGKKRGEAIAKIKKIVIPSLRMPLKNK